jgi:hypothetical protein
MASIHTDYIGLASRDFYWSGTSFLRVILWE